ncbi:MAG: DUF3710 domain-containing protein [Nocardioidaceae bacterium]
MIFRRKPRLEVPDGSEQEVAAPEPPSLRETGPWDRSETEADESDGTYVDLGGLVVKSAPSFELRLQVEEQSQRVAAVLLAGAESGLELRAFAAPRKSGIWADVRSDIVAEADRRGGAATEVEGAFGPELLVVVPAQTPDGRQATQTSRIVGVDGPRWMLRGTFLGKSSVGSGVDDALEQAFRDVIVVRGAAPMRPREILEMRMPEQAKQTWGEAESGSPDAEAAAQDGSSL